MSGASQRKTRCLDYVDPEDGGKKFLRSISNSVPIDVASFTITVYEPTRRHAREDFNFYVCLCLSPFIANELTCADMNIMY